MRFSHSKAMILLQRYDKGFKTPNLKRGLRELIAVAGKWITFVNFLIHKIALSKVLCTETMSWNIKARKVFLKALYFVLRDFAAK